MTEQITGATPDKLLNKVYTRLDQGSKAADTDPDQADAVQKGQGPAAADPGPTAARPDPDQADAVQEGQGADPQDPDRVQELFRLLKRAMDDQGDPLAIAQSFRSRQEAQLMAVAGEIEQLETAQANTIRQLRNSLAAVQRAINRTIENSQGDNPLPSALTAYNTLKQRFWEDLVCTMSADVKELSDLFRAEIRDLETDFRNAITEARRLPFRYRIQREGWLLVAAVVFGMLLAGVLITRIPELWAAVASLP